MNRIVIFDMDGVLINSEPLHYESEKAILAEYGLKYTREIHKMYIGTSEEEFWSNILTLYKVSLNTKELSSKKYKYFLDNISRVEPIEPAVRLVKTLYDSGIPLGLASSAEKELIKKVLKKMSLEKFFKIIQSGSDVKNAKPDPEIFLITAEKLGASPQECVVIEDSINGVIAGKSAGMTVVAVPNEYTKCFDLSFADFEIESLDDFMKLGLVRV